MSEVEVPNPHSVLSFGLPRLLQLTFKSPVDVRLNMANREYSAYQQNVIKRYYENRDAIDDQRLAELVTNLYLATGKKQAKMWETAEQIMQRMELPESRISHVMESKDPAVLARIVEELQNGRLKKGSGKKKQA